MTDVDFNKMRAVVDAAETTHAGTKRKCPHCGADCVLCLGRICRKFYWRHLNITECPYGSIGAPIFFPTNEQAIQATEIFN